MYGKEKKQVTANRKNQHQERLQANTAGKAINNTTVRLLNKNEGNLLSPLVQPGVERWHRVYFAVNIRPGDIN